MELEFEWDPHKAEANARKHGVTFSEASTAFRDPLSVTVPDPRHSLGEERFVLFGRSERGRMLAVMHTERGSRIRIISAADDPTREEGVCRRNLNARPRRRQCPRMRSCPSTA